MADATEVNVVETVGSAFCVASDDGQKVYEVIADALRADREVRVSFAGIEDLTSAFLNSAIGQLYNGEFTDEYLRAHLLPPAGASQEDLVLLKRVVQRAKEFFGNPAPFREAARAALGADDET